MVQKSCFTSMVIYVCWLAVRVEAQHGCRRGLNGVAFCTRHGGKRVRQLRVISKASKPAPIRTWQAYLRSLQSQRPRASMWGKAAKRESKNAFREEVGVVCWCTGSGRNRASHRCRRPTCPAPFYTTTVVLPGPYSFTRFKIILIGPRQIQFGESRITDHNTAWRLASRIEWVPLPEMAGLAPQPVEAQAVIMQECVSRGIRRGLFTRESSAR